MSTSELRFFDPVIQQVSQSWRQSLCNTAENYFYLGGKKAFLLNEKTKKGREKVVFVEGHISQFMKLTKIISYFTVVIFLAFLIVKIGFRCTHSFKIVQKKRHIGTEIPLHIIGVQHALTHETPLQELKVEVEISPNIDKEKQIQQFQHGLLEYYTYKNIQTGSERIDVDIETLGLDLNEHQTVAVVQPDGSKKKQTFFLREVAQYVVQTLNERILRYSAYDLPIQEKRRILLRDSDATFYSTHRLFFFLGLKPKKSEGVITRPGFSKIWTKEEKEKLWMFRVIRALINKGYLYGFSLSKYEDEETSHEGISIRYAIQA